MGCGRGPRAHVSGRRVYSSGVARTLLLTGFEPFLDVTVNPSGEIARTLDGVRLEGGALVRGVELPVSFARAPGALGEAAAGVGGDLLAIVSLGVHRGPQFRLEERAGARFASQQPDNDGAFGAAVELEGPEERRPGLDLGLLERALLEAGAESTMLSVDAGGYLCERVFREGLDLTAAGPAEGLFLHVPPVEFVPVEEQVLIVRRWLELLVTRALG